MTSYVLTLYGLLESFRRGWVWGFIASLLLVFLIAVKFYVTEPVYESSASVKIGQVSYLDKSWNRSRIFLEDPVIILRQFDLTYQGQMIMDMRNDGFMIFKLRGPTPEGVGKQMGGLVQGLLEKHNRLFLQWKKSVEEQLQRIVNDIEIVKGNEGKETEDAKKGETIMGISVNISREQQFALEQMLLGIYSTPTIVIQAPEVPVDPIGPNLGRYLYLGSSVVIVAGAFVSFVVGFYLLNREKESGRY